MLRLTIGFGISTVVLACLTGILYLMGFRDKTLYDPSVAMGALNAILLAAYTYFTRQALDVPRQIDQAQAARAEAVRIEHRASLATALLAEMAGLFPRLERIRDDETLQIPAGYIVHPMLDLAAGRPESFDPATVEAIVTTLFAAASLRTATGVRDATEIRMMEAFARASAITERQGGPFPLGKVLSSGDGLLHEHHVEEGERLSAQARAERLAIAARAEWLMRSILSLTERLQAAGGQMPLLPIESEMMLDTRAHRSVDPFPRPALRYRLHLVFQEDQLVAVPSEFEAQAAMRDFDLTAKRMDARDGIEALVYYPAAQQDLTEEQLEKVASHFTNHRAAIARGLQHQSARSEE